jgi:hypothetical protein
VPTSARVDQRDPLTCAGGDAIYTLGAKYAGALHIGAPGYCSSAGTSLGTDTYSLGSPIAPTTFAEVTTEQVPIETGAAAVVRTTADGLRVWFGGPDYGLYDPVHSFGAAVMKATDSKFRVIPQATLQVDLYKGGTKCTIPLASGHITCGIVPSGLALFQNNDSSDPFGCGQVTSVYTVGAPYTDPIYTAYNGCLPATAPADVVVYLSGDEVPLSSLPEAVPTNFGTGRVTAATYAVADHSIPPDGLQLNDPQTGGRCIIHVAGDGKRRCLPTDGATEYFSDSGCKTRIFGQPNSFTCAPLPRDFGISKGAGCDDSPWHIYALGAALPPGTPTFSYDPYADKCSPGPTRMSLFAAGAETDPTTFAEATLYVP